MSKRTPESSDTSAESSVNSNNDVDEDISDDVGVQNIFSTSDEEETASVVNAECSGDINVLSQN